jgi:F0F1-type ATP synthase membrane subunit c/vacuolar-type H+-ATPase subunit K
MTLALRKQFQPRSLPQVSFGPFRFLEALPWLIMAAAMRVVAFGGGAVAFPALVVASIAVLHAFLVVAQRSIELNHGQTNLGELDFAEQFRLSKAVLWRIALLMFAAGCALLAAGFTSFAPNMMDGLDGIAFDQWSDIGKFWSAAIAALVLLLIVDAERNHGRVSFMRALGEFARRGLWIGTAVLVLGVAYLGLGLGQGWVRSAIWNFWQVSASSQFIKNLIYFVFIFSFAMLRLWISLLILTYGLKQSYTRGS